MTIFHYIKRSSFKLYLVMINTSDSFFTGNIQGMLKGKTFSAALLLLFTSTYLYLKYHCHHMVKDFANHFPKKYWELLHAKGVINQRPTKTPMTERVSPKFLSKCAVSCLFQTPTTKFSKLCDTFWSIYKISYCSEIYNKIWSTVAMVIPKRFDKHA